MWVIIGPRHVLMAALERTFLRRLLPGSTTPSHGFSGCMGKLAKGNLPLHARSLCSSVRSEVSGLNSALPVTGWPNTAKKNVLRIIVYLQLNPWYSRITPNFQHSILISPTQRTCTKNEVSQSVITKIVQCLGPKGLTVRLM